ncbi:MAG: InlB B-repeat-containing protein, partial [Clostridia bacterium]|nr:InlB B-repeat-containing protein [Clostridia bacterium]
MKKTIKNLLTYILTSAAFLFLAVGFLMPKAETAYAEDTYYTVSFNTSRLSDVGITLNIPSQQVRSGDYAVKPTQITGDVEWWGDMPWDFDFNNTPITKDITIHLVGSGYSGYSDFKEQTIKAYKVDNEIVHVSVDENNYTPATPTKAGYTFDSWTASDIHITETLNYVIDYTVSGDNNAEEDIGNRAFSLKTARYFEWSGFIGFETSSDDIYNTTDMWIEQIGFYNGSTSIFSVQLLAYNGGHIIKLMAPKDGGGTNSKEYRFKSGSTVIDVGFESGFRSAGGVYLKVVLDKTTGKISLFVRRDNDSNRSWINPVIWNGGGQVFSNVDLTETSSHLVNSDVNMAKYMIRNMYDLTTSRGFTNQKVEAYGTGDVLYTAQFLENHTVTYMVDGNEYSREQVADGDNPTFPTPSKAQCTFSGWQVSGDNTLYGNGDGYVVTHDVTFNAVFTGEQYTITYMVDGQFWLSDNATYGEPYYITGWDVGEGQAPTKTGYTFTGWYLNDTRFTTPCSVESNITLTAGFEETYYTLSFYSDNVLVGTVSFPAYVNGNPSDDYHSNEWPTVTKTGYTFSHWAPYAAIDPNTGDYVYFFDNDARLDAIFTINTYTVTYMVNGAVYSTEQVSHGSSATFPTPQNNGLNFNGWKIYNGVDMLYGGNTGNTYTVTHNETFDAVFALEITYVVDGTTYDTETIDYNGSPTFPSPTKTHYTFVGWTLRGGDSRLYGNNSGNTYTVKSAATFDAEFEPVTYTATFIVDGTTTGKVTVTYPNSVTLSTPNKNHYTFDGWRISGSDENLTGSYQMTADTTFTAHFTADTYTATFVVDGLTAATENVVYPNAVTLPPQTKQGYTFDGWRISGSDENLTGSYQMTADTTFTAHFTINHTVTYELGDGTVYFMEQIPHGSNA